MPLLENGMEKPSQTFSELLIHGKVFNSFNSYFQFNESLLSCSPFQAVVRLCFGGGEGARKHPEREGKEKVGEGKCYPNLELWD